MEDRRTQAARTHFDRWSATYEQDRGARRLLEIQTRALQILRLEPTDVMRDLGCGTGAAVRQASAAVTRAVGVDLSPAMIERARDLAGTLANVEALDSPETARAEIARRFLAESTLPDPPRFDELNWSARNPRCLTAFSALRASTPTPGPAYGTRRSRAPSRGSGERTG